MIRLHFHGLRGDTACNVACVSLRFMVCRLAVYGSRTKLEMYCMIPTDSKKILINNPSFALFLMQ